MYSISMHWFLIIIGTFILSISISNPFYRLLIQKRIKLKTFLNLILRVIFFIIGLIVSYLVYYNMLKSDYYYFLVVGICGGLTTFSAFSMENLNFIKSNEILNSFIYIFISVSLCIALAYLGFLTMNKIFN